MGALLMAAPGQLVLWGIGTSRTIRAHWALAELGLEYETRPVLPRTAAMEDAAFQAVSPRHKVPILEDGPLIVGESAAIVLHLADRHRAKVQLTPDPHSDARSRLNDLCFFIGVEIDAALYVIRRHEGLPETYGAAPAAVDAAQAYATRQIGVLERQLADDRPHLLGEDFSAADLLLTSCLDWAGVCEIALSEGMAAYRDRMAARPAYAKAVANNFPPEAIAWLKAGAGANAPETSR